MPSLPNVVLSRIKEAAVSDMLKVTARSSLVTPANSILSIETACTISAPTSLGVHFTRTTSPSSRFRTSCCFATGRACNNVVI